MAETLGGSEGIVRKVYNSVPKKGVPFSPEAWELQKYRDYYQSRFGKIQGVQFHNPPEDDGFVFNSMGWVDGN